MAFRLLDTNIVSYLMKAHPLALKYRPHLIGFDLAVSFQTVAELYAGAVLAQWSLAKWSHLESILATTTIFQSDLSTCMRWSDVWVARRSQPIGIADCWIAATALTQGLELVTHNPQDFMGIPGLVIVTEAP